LGIAGIAVWREFVFGYERGMEWTMAEHGLDGYEERPLVRASMLGNQLFGELEIGLVTHAVTTEIHRVGIVDLFETQRIEKRPLVDRMVFQAHQRDGAVAATREHFGQGTPDPALHELVHIRGLPAEIGSRKPGEHRKIGHPCPGAEGLD